MEGQSVRVHPVHTCGKDAGSGGSACKGDCLQVGKQISVSIWIPIWGEKVITERCDVAFGSHIDNLTFNIQDIALLCYNH